MMLNGVLMAISKSFSMVSLFLKIAMTDSINSGLALLVLKASLENSVRI